MSSVISNGHDGDIFNRFLYNDLIACRTSFVSIYSSRSDCSNITQRLRLSRETLAPHLPTSVISGVTDLQETTEAHSKMLTQPQHYVALLDVNDHGIILRAEDISETSLVNKEGAIYIGGCKLNFPDGSFQTTVEVKLSCFYPLQVS